ncbi:hypothetical protein BH09BAC3_BH09BAC3_22130 [soil metagenome]
MEKRETSSDEIDLQELLLKFVLLVKRNFILIVAFFFLGSLLGFMHSFLSTKVYASKMMLSSNLLTESYVDRLGENFNAIIEDNNYGMLSERLGLSIAEASGIKSLDIQGILKEKPIENYTLADKGTRRTYFLAISASVVNTDILHKLQNGIINYLESNEFVRTNEEQNKIFLNGMIKKLDEEIVALDDFKKKIYEGTAENKGAVILDLGQINAVLVNLYEKKSRFQSELVLSKSIQIVEGFTAFRKPVRPRFGLSLAAGGSIGLLFVALMIAFKSIRALLKEAEKKG